MKTYGGVEVKLNALTSVLCGGEWSVYTPRRFASFTIPLFPSHYCMKNTNYDIILYVPFSIYELLQR
jgi:hypothetical protein